MAAHAAVGAVNSKNKGTVSGAFFLYDKICRKSNTLQKDPQNSAGCKMDGVVGIKQLADIFQVAPLTVVQPQQGNGQTGK